MFFTWYYFFELSGRQLSPRTSEHFGSRPPTLRNVSFPNHAITTVEKREFRVPRVWLLQFTFRILLFVLTVLFWIFWTMKCNLSERIYIASQFSIEWTLVITSVHSFWELQSMSILNHRKMSDSRALNKSWPMWRRFFSFQGLIMPVQRPPEN